MRAFRHLGYAFDMHTSQVHLRTSWEKSEIFIWQTTYDYHETGIFLSLFSTQLTHNIFKKRFEEI
jgi:hypothetical protein